MYICQYLYLSYCVQLFLRAESIQQQHFNLLVRMHSISDTLPPPHPLFARVRPIHPPIKWVANSFPWEYNGPALDVDHLLISSAEMKNEWSFTSTILTYLYGVGRYNFTFYGMDGPRIESRWGRDFSHPSRPALGPTQPSIQWVPRLSRG